MRDWLQNFRRVLIKEINIFYFIFFWLLITGMSGFHFVGQYSWLALFFLLHAIGQCILEVSLLILIAYVCKRLLASWLFYVFIGCSFSLLLAHFTEFTLLRLLDVKISYMFTYFFGSGVIHIISAFQALNMNPAMIILIFSSVLLIPFLGIAFYRITMPLSKKIPWTPSLLQLLALGFVTSGALFILDVFAHPLLTQRTYAKYQKALPMGTTFIKPKKMVIHLPKPIAQARDEQTMQKRLADKEFAAGSTPNIYLFIIETFRKDFLTQEIAPNLYAFGQENITFAESYSNANSTGTSWFSILHANYPYHWTHMRDAWQNGSIPLQVLKKLGYKIHVYSSADLRYFNMDVLLFGKDRKLIDHCEEYSQNWLIEPCERDRCALDAVQKDLEAKDGTSGNLFVIFLDSTHSEYSVPPDFPIRFQPIVPKIDYLTLSLHNLEPIKNRYRNAIAYVDSLMGRFFGLLKEKQLYQEAIIAITGDHGEEFFEEGAIFHGTHLNRYQTSVPILYKFQDNPWPSHVSCSTHLDILPSMIHHVTGCCEMTELFDGQSIFAPHRYPQRICVLQNGPDTPCEFSLDIAGAMFYFRLPDPARIYETTSLEVLFPEEPVAIDPALLFAPLLKRY